MRRSVLLCVAASFGPLACALPSATPPSSSPVYAALPAELEPVPVTVSSVDDPTEQTVVRAPAEATPPAQRGKTAESAADDLPPAAPAAAPAPAAPEPPAPQAPATEPAPPPAPPTSKPATPEPIAPKGPPPLPVPKPATPSGGR